MNELIKYLDSVLNIKIDNDLVIEDMKMELGKVKDFVAYRYYIRDHLDDESMVDFKTGFQKFIILTNKYLGIEEDARLIKVYTGAELYAKIVSDKVMQCRTTVEDESVLFRQIRVEGERFFEEHELKCLFGIGNTMKIIEFSKLHLLEGLINDYYAKSFKAKKAYEQPSVEQKKVHEMIGKVSR